MTTCLIESAESMIEKIVKLFDEFEEFDLISPDRNLPRGELQRQYEISKPIVREKIKRFELYVRTLKATNQNWLDLIQKTTIVQKKKEEEERYLDIVNDKRDTKNLLNSDKRTIVTLNSY